MSDALRLLTKIQSKARLVINDAKTDTFSKLRCISILEDAEKLEKQLREKERQGAQQQ